MCFMGLFKKKDTNNMNAYMNKNQVELLKYNKKKESPKKKIMITGISIIGVSFIFFIVVGILTFSIVNKNKTCEHAKGRVIDVHDYFFLTDYYRSTIEYEVNGQIYNIDRFRYNLNPDNINEKYGVLYYKDNPEGAYLVINEVEKIIIVGVIGFVVLLGGIFVFVWGNNMPIVLAYDNNLEIPRPNDVYLKQVAEEKARIAAEKAAYEAEQARLAAEQAAAEAAAQAERENGITPAMKAAMAAQNSDMNITFLNVDPTKMIPKKEVKKQNTTDDGLNAAEKAMRAAQGMDIVFQEVDPSQFELKKKKVVSNEDDGLDPAQRAAKAAASSDMNIAFLPVDPNNNHTARGGHGGNK